MYQSLCTYLKLIFVTWVLTIVQLPFKFSKRRKPSYYNNICIPTPTELFLIVLNEY